MGGGGGYNFESTYAEHPDVVISEKVANASP